MARRGDGIYQRGNGTDLGAILSIVALAALLALTGCTTVDNLKPGVARGTMESGFMKTTEGLSMAIPNRSYAEVWAAAEKAMRAQGLTVVSLDQAHGVLRSANQNFMGLDKAYIGIFITPTTPAAPSYTVEVSKILKNRTDFFDSGTDFEVTLLRAIQADVGGK
jgi:hypothetical protein